MAEMLKAELDCIKERLQEALSLQEREIDRNEQLKVAEEAQRFKQLLWELLGRTFQHSPVE
eukprot:4073969-Amphidinium_carterae.2